MNLATTETTWPEEQTAATGYQTPEPERAEVHSPSNETVDELVQLFKLLADETRLKILFMLQQNQEMNVLELCHELQLRQPSVSHHLALLRVAGLIEMRREGKHNYYHILPERMKNLVQLMFRAVPGGPSRIELDGFELKYTATGKNPC